MIVSDPTRNVRLQFSAVIANYVILFGLFILLLTSASSSGIALGNSAQQRKKRDDRSRGRDRNTGRAVARELKKLGHDPVCIVRNPEKAREVLGADTKTAVAELTDRNALEKALQGVESAFLVTGHNPNMVEQESNVLDAALKTGTKYLVHVSAVSGVAKRDSDAGIGRSHYAIEEKLRGSGGSDGSSCGQAC